MAELLNPTFTGNKELFFEALKIALTDAYNTEADGKNIIPIVYEIFAEKLAEVDRLVAAHKNDDYLSVIVSDEFILRSKEIADKLLKESSFKIDRIGLTSSTEIFTEAQVLEEGTETIVLTNVPSDFLNIIIFYLYDSKSTATIGVTAFDETTNTVTLNPPIQTSSSYRIEYTTTGDVFDETEIIDVPAATTRIELENASVLYASEKLNIRDGTTFIRDVDYVINFVDGIIDFVDSSVISGKQLVARYKYRRELLDDIELNSHIPVTNEIGSIDIFDPSLIRVQHQPIQDIVRVQNITTGEIYIITTVSGNEISIGGNELPANLTTTNDTTIISRSLDFSREREVVQGALEYPTGFTPINNPLVSLDELDTTTDNIRLVVANQIITGRDATIYRRITQSETLVSTSTTITLDFAPVRFEEVIIYASGDVTKTNLIIPIEYDETTRLFTFTPINSLTDGDYVVQYDTLEWLIYINRDVSDITLITGGTLLKNAFRRLLLNDDYTFSNDDETTIRLKFTWSAANKVGNTSVFYVLDKELFVFEEPTLSDETYQFSFHGSLKNELVTFTNDPLDLIPLVKLKRFRTKGQTADVITNPTIQVFSTDGTKEYIENTDFTVNYVTHLIKRVDILNGISPNETVKIFYYDEQTIEANFTFISDIVQVDYEYGDNSIDWSPSITDTPVTQTTGLQLGASKVVLDYYPADFEAVEIINIAYPDKPFTTPRTFDPVTRILGFDQVVAGGTYRFNYDKREQPINQGVPYYVSYRYGARRDALQNSFAQLVNIDIGIVEREDEYNLLTGATTQILDYLPVDFKKVKIYKKDNSETIATTATDYNFMTNVLTFDPVEDADTYVFEYDTFRRDVDQLRRGLIGVYKAIPLGPTKDALSTLIKEFTSADPIIENVSDKRFKIRRRYSLAEALEPGDTYLSINSVAFLPKSGTLTVIDVDKEDLTYDFITDGKLQGLSTITFSHPVGTRVDIHDEVAESYKLNPAVAKEAPDLSDGSRAIVFTASKFDAGLLCESSRKAYVNYKAVNNINTEEGTIGFWTGTKYDGDDNQNHYYIDVTDSKEYENRLSIYKSKRGYLNFDIRNGSNKLMSVRAKVETEIITETISLTSGDTEVTLSDMPSLISGDRDTDGLSQIFQNAEYEFIAGLYNGTDGIVSGTELTLKGYNRETDKLVVDAVPTTGTYYFSYVTGFVDFDESRHFIEAAWKTHVRDGLEPRIKMFIDGIKYIPVSL